LNAPRFVEEQRRREDAHRAVAREQLKAFKFCGCGCHYSKEQWMELPLCGHQQGDELLEMRNCISCKSTLAVTVTPNQRIRSLAAKVAQTKGASDIERLVAAGVLANLVLATVPE
jgi:hypothetical protein